MEALDDILSRSNEFAESIFAVLESAGEFAVGPRPEAAGSAAALSFEHAHAMRVLFAAGAPNSACVLLRAQYEALLRSAWLLYAASEEQLQKLAVPLSSDARAAAKNARGAEAMLKELEQQLVAVPGLRGLVLPLREIREYHWTAMNSFVHGGLHPISRTLDGFPVKLANDLLKNSNGMLHMAARLLARLTPHADLVTRVEQSYMAFHDCLPVITPQVG